MVHSLTLEVLGCTEERDTEGQSSPILPKRSHKLKLEGRQLYHQTLHWNAVCLQNNNYDCPLPEEETNPKGSSWLYHSDAIRTYLNLMGKSKKDATLEACAGALQNLTASKGLVRNPTLPFLQPTPCIFHQTLCSQAESLKHIRLLVSLELQM